LHELQWVDLFPDWAEGFSLVVKTIQKQTGQPVDTPSAPDDIVVETITTAETFRHRFHIRGEMRGCDAMEIAFHDLPLASVDLAGANFVRCQFTACDFQDANLKGVNFEGAVFRECRFAGGNLWGVNFWGADITGVLDFEHAALSYTNFFRTQFTTDQEDFISKHPGALHLGDYGTFVEYFSEDVGLGGDRVARTFVWLNHRYFRMMFGKNTGRIFRMKTLFSILGRKSPNNGIENDD